MKWLLMVVLWLAVAVPAIAQERFQFFPVYSDGQANYVYVLIDHSGWEFWHYDGTAGEKEEVVSPRFAYKKNGVDLKAGLYGRFEKSQVSRLGVATMVTIGDPRGWQLTGPVYVFVQRGSDGMSDLGGWAPNMRLTRRIDDQTRGGIGWAYTKIEGREDAAVLGVYVQRFLDKKKQKNIQIRLGKILAPRSQSGDLQLFLGYTGPL